MKLKINMVIIAITAIIFITGCKKNSTSSKNYMMAVINGTSWQSNSLSVELANRGLGDEPSKITGFLNNSEISFWIPAANTGSYPFRNNQVNPATLLYFTGENFESSHLLKWATGTETNLSHFNVELSTDGLTWSTTATVNATGSGSTYQTVALNIPDPWIRSYYRLKIFDTNGNYQYSTIIVISGNYPAYYKPSGDLARRGYSGNLEIISINRDTRVITGHFYFKIKTTAGQLYDITNGEFQTSY
jgi:hypothetical protein